MGRQNTIRIDYGALPNKPNIQKVQKFCAEKLGLKRGEVIRIQSSRALGVTFVTVVDLALALKVCEEHNNKHEVTGSDKKLYPVTITIEDGTVLVKLFDLSDDVPNTAVTRFLERYGEVRDVYEEVFDDAQEFAGAYTGVRIAKMVVRENIASWVSINGELTFLSYFGQRQTCKHCQDSLHIGVGCVQNKKLLVQKTFADAVKQPAKPLNPKPKATQQQPPKTNADKPKQPEPINPDQTVSKQTGDGKGSSSLMPPPADVLPVNHRLMDKFPSSGGGLDKPTSGKSDDNDTDASTSSRKSSLRPKKPKKPRYNDDDQGDVEEDL